MSLKREVKKSFEIADGEHTGTIVSVEVREEPYAYIEPMVKVDGFDELNMKYSCPDSLSQNSKLGKLLVAFGAEIDEGEEVDIEEILLGRKVKFMTQKIKGKGGREFSEIIVGTLKPAN